jgi:hypothetical protein
MLTQTLPTPNVFDERVLEFVAARRTARPPLRSGSHSGKTAPSGGELTMAAAARAIRTPVNNRFDNQPRPPTCGETLPPQ